MEKIIHFQAENLGDIGQRHISLPIQGVSTNKADFKQFARNESEGESDEELAKKSIKPAKGKMSPKQDSMPDMMTLSVKASERKKLCLMDFTEMDEPTSSYSCKKKNYLHLTITYFF